jgi:uncharacterized protein YutE (UPF0331/DUF86 family)
MLDLHTLIKLADHDNSVVGKNATQAITIAQNLENKLITKEEATELLNDVALQNQIVTDAEDIEIKAVIDNAIADLLTAISILPIP